MARPVSGQDTTDKALRFIVAVTAKGRFRAHSKTLFTVAGAAEALAGAARIWPRSHLTSRLTRAGVVGEDGRQAPMAVGRILGRYGRQNKEKSRVRFPGLNQPGNCAGGKHCQAKNSVAGNCRMRLPVAANIALATAGGPTGVPGSPTPVGASPEGTICTSIAGISFMRSTR